MDIFALCALGLTAALCALVVKQRSADIGIVLGLAACAALLLALVPAIEEILTAISGLAALSGLSEQILEPVLKTVGVAILTKLAAEICRDAKEGGIASFVELAGSVAAILLALPLLNMVLEMIGGLL